MSNPDADGTAPPSGTEADESVASHHLTEEEWLAKLGPERYRILRQAGTERAFSGELYHQKADGMYRCGGCGAELFRSDHKYESGSGWPSFWQPLAGDRVRLTSDNSHGMTRTRSDLRRVRRAPGPRLSGRPRPTGTRYCINSLSLDFEPDA